MAIACGNGRFKVQGVITEAQDSVVFLENMALDGPQKVDSARLSADGEFSFSCDAPKDAPEFYRLRIAQQIINFSVDSIETLTVKASYPTMMSDYEIEGGTFADATTTATPGTTNSQCSRPRHQGCGRQRPKGGERLQAKGDARLYLQRPQGGIFLFRSVPRNSGGQLIHDGV